MVENIGDIRNDFDSFQKLINFYHRNKDNVFRNIELKLNWFSANNCSVLGALLSILQDNLNAIQIDAGLANNILEKNGFLSFFGHNIRFDNFDTTISYKILTPHDERFFNSYIFNELLCKECLPQLSEPLKKKIAEAIYEIFINAKMHSGTKKIFTCGQHFPAKKKIDFMITDLGVGIRESINNRFQSEINAIDAIKWAVINEHTIKQGVSGGIGLAILQEFIAKNKGELQIISNNGYWKLDESGIYTRTFEKEFPGTIINISVRTDDTSSYVLADEENVDNIF